MAVSTGGVKRPAFPRVVVVVGPTAAGKTKLAVNLARQFGGEIIAADSRQVYRGLDIGSGKDHHEYGRVPAHLLDVASPKGQFTAARYQLLARRAVEQIVGRGKLPIICGGTALYVDAVTHGLQFPKVRITDFEFRQLRARLQRLSEAKLLDRLRRVDSATYAVIDRKNRRRVERALEIYYASGYPKSALQAQIKPPYQFLVLGVHVPKAVMHQRITKRLAQRLRQGLVAEVRRLHQQGVSFKRLEAFGLEYRWVARYLRGQVDRRTMEASLLRDIKQFARRQMVWWKRNHNIVWVTKESQAKNLVRKFLRS